jgi:dTDP-4-amino-4,6-dideoxygalactose transaminase
MVLTGASCIHIKKQFIFLKDAIATRIINVTKAYLPERGQYEKYLDQVWESAWLTNNGPLLQQLERELKEYLDVKHLFFCSNGTIAIQIAIKALGLTKEVITTPFSYVATTNSILWEQCKPVFVDINTQDFNIDAEKIEAAITPQTQAILATHVYGNPCDVARIEKIAQKHQLKVIYDGAHAFGSLLQGKQVLSFGDIATCSFHATKLFHTVEGGCIITDNDELAHTIMLYRQFGHINDDYFTIGINGKNSEFHAAMGLCILPEVDDIIKQRRRITETYMLQLKSTGLQFPVAMPGVDYNYAYLPVLFSNEQKMLELKGKLAKEGINTRRYFYPSLNKLPFNSGADCKISEDISARVLSLPLYYDLELSDVNRICELIKQNL